MGHLAREWAARFVSCASEGNGARHSVRLLIFVWAVFAGAALMLLLPARYTAFTTLSFDVAAQPAPATVRGITQMLTSREMTFEVLDSLPPADAAMLARPAGLPRWLSGEERPARDQAAARLGAEVSVTPHHGGRTLEIAATAGTPDLAVRIVRAYAQSFSKLQSGARDEAPDLQEWGIPPLSIGGEVQKPAGRDPPSWSIVLMLGGLALGLFFLSARLTREPSDRADAPTHDLPHQTAPSRRVAWLDGGQSGGLTCIDGTRRLADHVRRERDKAGARLIIITSEASTPDSAVCAIHLARRLAEESRVALVALDGASGELAALISDPRASGVAEMLFGVAGFGETIHRDPHSRAHVIPPGRDALAGATAVGADRLNLILNALHQTYDFVVVASPVLGGVTSASRLAELSPLIVCIEDAGEEPASVEGYDALAALGFANVLMLRIAPPKPEMPSQWQDAPPRGLASLSAA